MDEGCFVFSWLVLLALGTSGRGRADEPADENVRAAEFLTKAKQEAASYSFRSDIPGTVFTLHPEPILKWSNPVVGSIHGSVYIWTSHGRPEAIASIFKWYSPAHHQTNEFQSLSLGTFVMERDGQPVWTPSRAGVELQPLPESPAPAGTPAQRLRQMREPGDAVHREPDRSQELSSAKCACWPNRSTAMKSQKET